MANSLPVLTIDIDDSKIKRLEEVAKQFYNAFKAMPSGKTFSNNSIEKKESDKWININNNNLFNNKNNKEEEKYYKNISKAQKESEKALRSLNQTLKQTVNISSNLFSTALSWGTRLLSISSLGAIAGFGVISSATSQGSSNYSGAQGLGLLPHQVQAIQNVYGTRFPGIESLVGQISQAKSDISSPLRRLGGLDWNKDAAELLPYVLNRIKSIGAQGSNNGLDLNILKAYGLNVSPELYNQIKRNDLPSLAQQYNSDLNKLSSQVSEGSYKNLQDAQAQLATVTTTLKNSFLSLASNLTPLISTLSKIVDNIPSFLEENYTDKNNPNSKSALWENSWEKKLWEAGKSAANGDWGKVKSLLGAAWNISLQQDLSFFGKSIPNANASALTPSGKSITDKIHQRLIQVESGWNPNAYNKSSGAIGLGQIIPSTAKAYGFDIDRLKSDPEYNLWASRIIFDDNLKRYNGNYPKALAQYNGGNKAVKGDYLDIPLETVNYLLKILGGVPEVAESNSSLLNRLNIGREILQQRGGNGRVIIELASTPGSDNNLQFQSQGLS